MKISKGFLFSLITMVFWAFAIVNTRFLLINHENPLNFTVWLHIFAFIPWLFLVSKHLHEFKRISKKTLLILLVIGVAGSIGVNYLQSLSLQNTSAMNFAFLYRTIVIFTIIFAAIFFKEKITNKKIVLVIFILIGTYLLTTNGRGIIFSKGDIYTIIMAASAAFISNILVKHTVSKMHTDFSASLTSIIATITLLNFAIFTKVFVIPHNILLILIGSFLYFFQILFRNRAYKHATASFVTMVFCLTPFLVSLISFFMLHEKIEPISLVGGIIIVGSTFFVEKFKV